MTMTDRQIVELIESPFWQDWTTSTTPVNPGWWNLTLSVRDLKMWSRGIKPNRNWKVSDVKSYFNIRGNKDSLVTQIEAIQTFINELQEGDMNQVHRVNSIIEEYFDMVPKEAESFAPELNEFDYYQCDKCATAFEDEDAADYCCSACYACGYADHVGFERGQKCCPCDCDETGGGPNGTCQEMEEPYKVRGLKRHTIKLPPSKEAEGLLKPCGDCGRPSTHSARGGTVNRCDRCWPGDDFAAETFEAMSWHDPRWAGDRENVEAKFKMMYPTYTIEDDSVDYLVYSGGASNKFHVFFLATDPAGNYHSFNAYGRIGYSPTLHHNAGPGTKGSVTQAISKKRQKKAKKGYVQQAETFEAEGEPTISYWQLSKSGPFNSSEANISVDFEGRKFGGKLSEFNDEGNQVFGADNFGDMEYILLNMLTDEQLEEEYGDFMRDEGVGRKELPQRLQDRYRTDEEAEYLREKYLEPEDFDAEYDFQNQAVTTIIADEEDEAYETFARTYDPQTEDWEIIDVRDAEGGESFLSENDYEKVELVKPIRTGWSLGAGIALFSVTATLVAATLTIPLLGKIKGE